MKRCIVGVLLCLMGTPKAQAQQELLAPYAAKANQQKRVQLDRALSAFRSGSTRDGLVQIASIYRQDSTDQDVIRLYRLNAARYAMRTAEDCDMEATFSNCDTALKYITLAKRLGDSSVYHEVRAQALYQKLVSLEVTDFTEHREAMPSRMLTKDMAYRYLPEERKIFFKELIHQTIGEVAVARGDLDKKDKLAELNTKIKVIERSQRLVGSR